MRRHLVGLAGLGLAVLAGCSDSPRGERPAAAPREAPAPPAPAEAHQVPPAEAAALEAWLAQGHYQRWACEPAARQPRGPSPHGRTRVCNNLSLVGHTGSGPFPVGAASVTERLDDHGRRVGYAVSRRTGAGPGADSWYWYEKVAGHLVAEGQGARVCAGCHAAAGGAALRLGQDYVYTRVGPAAPPRG